MKRGRRRSAKRERARRPAGKRPGYRQTVRLVRDHLRPVEPPARLIIEIRDLGQAFGTDVFLTELDGVKRKKLRGLVVVCALPLVGAASYALARHYQHRQDLVLDEGMMTPA